MQNTVLIVEDEILIAEGHRLSLEEMGWTVIGPTGTVRGSLALLDRETPSVALLDMQLGKDLVTPVAQVLRERCIPFVMASACADPVAMGGPVFIGVENVGKPVSDRTLNQALSRALGSR